MVTQFGVPNDLRLAAERAKGNGTAGYAKALFDYLCAKAPQIGKSYMTKKQKLELTWVGKENRPRLEPRILLEDTTKSYHAAHRIQRMIFSITA